MRADLFKVARNCFQRLVEREGHVPGLAREDRKNGREFSPELAAWKQAHEEYDCKGEEAEDRHRLKDVQRRNNHALRSLALGGKRGHDEGEEQ